MSTKRRRPVQAKRRMSMKNILVMAACLALVAVVSIGGTIAWLTATTAPVTNTFTVGDINITLAETTTDYKMVPGNTINKDPKVTVKANSEACWLFVKVEESSNLGSFIGYTIADDWVQLKDKNNTDVKGVYYREVSAVTADTAFSVLKDDRVTVKDDVTKAMMNSLTDTTRPTLTFTAYAVQKDNVTTAADAWEKLFPPTNP